MKKAFFYIFIVLLLATSNTMAYLLYDKLQRAKAQIVLINTHVKSNYDKLGIALDGKDFVSLIPDEELSYLKYLKTPKLIESPLAAFDDLTEQVIKNRIQLASYIKGLGVIFAVPRIEEKQVELLVSKKAPATYASIFSFLKAYEKTSIIHRKTIKSVGNLLSVNLLVANLLEEDESKNQALIEEKLNALNDNFSLLKKSLLSVFKFSKSKIKANEVEDSIKELSRNIFIREGFTRSFNKASNNINSRYNFYLNVEKQYLKTLDLVRKLKKEVNSYKRELRKFANNNKKDPLEKELKKVQQKLFLVKNELASIKGPVKVFSNVIDYDEVRGICTFNRGTKGGVKKGKIYDVWRFGQFVCRVKVIKVNKTTSKAVVDFSTIIDNNLPQKSDYLLK